MNPQLTPDDVRAIVRDEIGVDCPLSPEVAAEALRAKAVAGLVVQDTRGLGTDGPLDADDARFEPMKRGEDRDDLGLQTGVAVGNGGDELLAERLGLDVVRRKVGDVVPDEPGERRIHNDSSSVVPGVAPSGDDATVEVTGDTARVDSSPRRVAGTHAPIQPPYTLYTLTVEPTPGLVTVVESELDGTLIRSQDLDPDQARDLAAWLIEAADQAEAVQA